MKKNLKETNLVLEACKKEYQKLYLAPRKFEKKKQKTKSSRRNCLNIGAITRVEQQTKFQLHKIKRLNLAISSLTMKN